MNTNTLVAEKIFLVTKSIPFVAFICCCTHFIHVPFVLVNIVDVPFWLTMDLMKRPKFVFIFFHLRMCATDTIIILPIFVPFEFDFGFRQLILNRTTLHLALTNCNVSESAFFSSWINHYKIFMKFCVNTCQLGVL